MLFTVFSTFNKSLNWMGWSRTGMSLITAAALRYKPAVFMWFSLLKICQLFIHNMIWNKCFPKCSDSKCSDSLVEVTVQIETSLSQSKFATVCLEQRTTNHALSPVSTWGLLPATLFNGEHLNIQETSLLESFPRFILAGLKKPGFDFFAGFCVLLTKRKLSPPFLFDTFFTHIVNAQVWLYHLSFWSVHQIPFSLQEQSGVSSCSSECLLDIADWIVEKN